MNLPLTLEQIEKILYNRTKDDQYTTLKSIPRPQELKDIEKATSRIVDAINKQEIINIVGDYDVDGVVSTAIITGFFNKIGIEVNYIIPNRFDHGYGLSPVILDQIDSGIIITVDNGISAYEAAEICKRRGIDLIITDHHTVGEKLPEAYAIVNPKQSDCNFPFKDICGAQVAWYLCASIKSALKIEFNLMEFFDLLALAIVADIMPMVSLNRTMVAKGLSILEYSKRPSIKALKERFSLRDINEEDIGFKIAPLINSAGRMSDPIIALKFLLSDDKNSALYQLDQLISLNEQRKQQQLQMFEEAKAMVDPNDDVIVVSSDKWNEGIIGIVASKLCEKYKKPSIVFSKEGVLAKASGRSTSEIDLYKLIKSAKDLLKGFGGHKQAAGLSIDSQKIEDFKTVVNQNITECKNLDSVNEQTIGNFCISDVGDRVYNLIESYRPYGLTNIYPLFTFKNLEVLGVQKIGRNKEYSKLVVSNGKETIEVLIFTDLDEVQVGQRISCIAQVSKNDFRNEVSYNLMLKELI